LDIIDGGNVFGVNTRTKKEIKYSLFKNWRTIVNLGYSIVKYAESLESRSAPPVVCFSASAASGSVAGGFPFCSVLSLGGSCSFKSV
jgi:hypothetical protein